MNEMTENNMNQDQKFEKLLETALKPRADARADSAAVERVLKRLSGPLPRQKFAWRWPTVLLDWQFAPSWPRVAALATCAVLGFVIGLIGLDRQVDSADAALAYVSRADLVLLFDSEPPAGTKPGALR
jgi:hypothetical protein